MLYGSHIILTTYCLCPVVLAGRHYRFLFFILALYGEELAANQKLPGCAMCVQCVPCITWTFPAGDVADPRGQTRHRVAPIISPAHALDFSSRVGFTLTFARRYLTRFACSHNVLSVLKVGSKTAHTRRHLNQSPSGFIFCSIRGYLS